MVKTMKIKDPTHARLAKHGNILESFDDVLNKIMDRLEVLESNVQKDFRAKLERKR